MRRGFLFLAILGVIVLLVPACQQKEPGPELGSETIPIINGTPDTSTAHSGVVFINNATGWCSGTLLTPTVVLTAAHCDDADSVDEYEVLFGNELASLTPRSVTEVQSHPGWVPAPDILNDIALFRLATPAPDWAVPIPHLPASMGLTQDDMDETLEYVGFGRDENGMLGTKRTITLPIHAICTDPDWCQVTLGENTYWARPQTVCREQSAGGPCAGDSGGPAFLVRNNVEYVAGVTSYGDPDCEFHGCSTMVQAHEDFINDFIGAVRVNGQSCSSAGQCYSGFCAGGVCCESACTAECMWCADAHQPGTCVPAEDGYPCPNADPCDGEETCQAGVCTGGTPPDCSIVYPCRTGVCETGTGCVTEPVADGTSCDNDDACDGVDECLSGQCQGVGPAPDCSDSNVCTQDLCDASSGCIHPPEPDGTSCTDHDPCNGEETCQSGVCTSGEPLDCDDQNDCTIDSCVPALQCKHEPFPDGDSCGKCGSCQAGECVGDENCSSGCGCGTTPNRAGFLFAWLVLGCAVFFERNRSRS
jgi:hypothetical protein